MGDLLIRNIPENIRRGIEQNARETGRSLSDVAKEIMMVGLQQSKQKSTPQKSAWDAMREAIGNNGLSDDEHAEFEKILEMGRQAGDRQVPEFE